MREQLGRASTAVFFELLGQLACNTELAMLAKSRPQRRASSSIGVVTRRKLSSHHARGGVRNSRSRPPLFEGKKPAEEEFFRGKSGTDERS
jgi:hypothetical protein